MDIGSVRWGTTDPGDSGFDDRNLVDGSDKALEVRLPWSMLGFADPSRRSVYVTGRLVNTAGFAWDQWAKVGWHERRKQGFSAVAEAFSRAAE